MKMKINQPFSGPLFFLAQIEKIKRKKLLKLEPLEVFNKI